MDGQVLDGFDVARAPARGRFRLQSIPIDGTPSCTIGFLDAIHDRSIQITLRPDRAKLLGVWSRSVVLRSAWAWDRGEGHRLVARGTARLRSPADVEDLLDPLRRVDPDLVVALDLLRLGGEHHVTTPDGRSRRLVAEVDPRGVLRVDTPDEPLAPPLFFARADATEHDLIPGQWPPLVEDVAPDRRDELAPLLPTVWRQAVDLLRDACRPS